jgi:hypothetical protein
MKAIPGYPDYLVSPDGDIFSCRVSATPKKRTATLVRGYRYVSVRNSDGVKTMPVHRLVALTYLDPPPNGASTIVNHKDGNKQNNAVSNLEWTTPRGNAIHYQQQLAPTRRKNKQLSSELDLKKKIIFLGQAFETFKDQPEVFAKVFAAVKLEMRA